MHHHKDSKLKAKNKKQKVAEKPHAAATKSVAEKNETWKHPRRTKIVIQRDLTQENKKKEKKKNEGSEEVKEALTCYSFLSLFLSASASGVVVVFGENRVETQRVLRETEREEK